MIKRLFLIGFLSMSLLGCNGQTDNTIVYETVEPLHIHRFDKDLFRVMETNDSVLVKDLFREYPQMLDILGKAILNQKSADVPGFFAKLRNYFSEPTLRGLYKDAITQYDSIEKVEKDLGYGFAFLKLHFPSMQLPAIYMHVSGLNQNVLVGDSLLSLSIDKYMGKDYPLYQDFFYEYQKRKMQTDLIVPDFLSGWIMSEFSFEGKENVLLDRLIYEGKIKYLLANCLKEVDVAALMGYTEDELQWCIKNEAAVWKSIIERKHLYTPDQQTTQKYFEAAPLMFNEFGAPGNLGTWIGWQIVNQYMKETGTTVESLMSNQDAQEILTSSKYKP